MYLTTIKLEESETINYMVPRTYQYVTTIVTISTKGMIYKPVLHHKKNVLDAENRSFCKGAYFQKS